MSDAAAQPKPAEPTGELAIRTIAMPAAINPSGDVFGGWVVSYMDLAAGISAVSHAKGRVVTAGITQLSFLRPVKVGDVMCCYTDLTRTGRTSLTLRVEAWVLRRGEGDRLKVTEADFTMFAVDAEGRPRPL